MEYDLLLIRHELLRAIRTFFFGQGYIEVETPALIKNAPPDPYIDPLNVYIAGKGPYRLHTSPEMHMKRLLQFGHERIFQICKVYRVEEVEQIHSSEFTMLEWYRKGTYSEAMQELEDLVRYVSDTVSKGRKRHFGEPLIVYDLEELFYGITGLNPFLLNREGFFDAMKSIGFAGIDDKDTWNDLFFKLFIQEIEPRIAGEVPYFIKDWPSSISTMAKKKGADKVERFELYMSGMEVANGYTELLDPEEQRNRFIIDNRERERLGKDTFELDEGFLEALSKTEGPYAGVSLGVDRLLMALLKKENIDNVMINRFRA
jgi:elongation factor P--(R)-beta-lysine ligase